MLALLLLFISVIKIEAEFKLIFSDEFNQKDSIDQNIWNIENEEENQICNGNYVGQLNCKTNNKTNLQLINGTLVLAAIQQKYANKEYTSPLITTTQSFTFGRFEIRAALPKGKMLRTAIYMVPTLSSKDNEIWATNGQIDILVNQQDQILINGLHGAINNNKEHKFAGATQRPPVNLNDFHIYGMEWTNKGMIWTFDGKFLTSKIVSEEFQNNPFDKPFKLRISLGVGGPDFFPHQTLTPDDAKNWNCSLLILDYVRVYQNIEENVNEQNYPKIPEQNKIRSTEICNTIMPLIRNKTNLIEENQTIDSTNNYDYSLIFFDEFNDSNFINPNKWYVSHEDQYCDGNHINQLNCKTNSPNNLQLINGTLVLAAIRQKYLDREYTSPMITTYENFTFGKFEIRAALPKGKMLRTAIVMTPTISSVKQHEIWATNGQIDILVNQQGQLLIHGLHGTTNNNKEHKFAGATQTPKGNLNDFHIYGMEWNNKGMTWTFDGKFLTSKIVSQEFQNNPFDKPFKLRIVLGVGGPDFFPYQTLTSDDAKNWNCSLLILDYVRIYQRTEQTSIVSDELIENDLSSLNVCNNVMKFIRNISSYDDNLEANPSTNNNNNKIVTIIAISSFLLLLAIVPSIIYMFIRIRKSTGRQLNTSHVFYKNDGIDLYEETNQSNNLYSDTYESTELYDNVYSRSREEHPTDYIQMTNKYK